MFVFYAEIPLFVVMPNHIHAIVIVDRGCGENATDCIVSGENKTEKENVVLENNREKTTTMAERSPKCGTLAVVVRGFKSAVTRYAHQHGISFQWQSRYYDRIIRDRAECNRIADYITHNVANWEMDKYYK